MKEIFGIVKTINIKEFLYFFALVITVLGELILQKRRSVYQIILSLIVLFIAFGYRQLIYIVLTIIVNIAFMYLRLVNSWFLTAANIAMVYFYKLNRLSIEPSVVNAPASYNISGVLMINAIKACYLGCQYKINDDKLMDIIGYFLHPPGLLLPPPPPYEIYIEKELVVERKKFPFFIFMMSMLYLCLYLWLRSEIDITQLYNENASGACAKYALIYLSALSERFKFYFAWNFSHGCYIIQGFPEMKNIDFFKIEFARDVKDLTDGWNIYTNLWLKKFFFNKLKDKSYYFAGFVTFTVSALWHSYYPEWLLLFLSFFILIPILKNVNKIYKRIFMPLYPVVTRIQMMFLLGYISLPFVTQNLKNTILAWKNVYFAEHIYLIFCIMLILTSRLFSRVISAK